MQRETPTAPNKRTFFIQSGYNRQRHRRDFGGVVAVASGEVAGGTAALTPGRSQISRRQWRGGALCYTRSFHVLARRDTCACRRFDAGLLFGGGERLRYLLAPGYR